MLVCLPLREDGIPAGESGVLSLQRRCHSRSFAHSTRSGAAALAAFRILRALPADAGRIAGDVSSGANGERDFAPANSNPDSGCFVVGNPRLFGVYVCGGRGGARALHAAGGAAGDAGADFDAVATGAI